MVLPGGCLDILRRTTKIFSQYGRYSGQDSNTSLESYRCYNFLGTSAHNTTWIISARISIKLNIRLSTSEQGQGVWIHVPMSVTSRYVLITEKNEHVQVEWRTVDTEPHCIIVVLNLNAARSSSVSEARHAWA